MKKAFLSWPAIVLVLIAIPLLTVFADSSQPLNEAGVQVDKFIYLPFVIGGTADPVSNTQPGDCYTSEEGTLLTQLNDYRNQNSLPDVAYSKSLTAVAQWHVIDLFDNNPDSGTDPNTGLACNLHSWSDRGIWSPVCYTSDHTYATGMWNKPREITSNVYNSNGYENAFYSSGTATAADALDGWKSSPGHNQVILEQGVWSGFNWQAVGVGIYENYAVLWFGQLTDPQGTVDQCQ